MQRNRFIDAAKGIGILFVVFGHNWLVVHQKGLLFRLIFSFHMPFFFLLSGVFLKHATPIGAFARSKAASLLKPYFIVLFAVCWWDLADKLLRTGTLGASDLLPSLNVFYGTGSSIPWPPLWYLPHLFMASIFSVLILRSVQGASSRTLLSLCLGLLGAGYLLLQYMAQNPIHLGNWKFQPRVGLPWSIDLLPVTSSFMILGYAARDRIKHFSTSNIGLALALLAFAALHLCFSETLDLNLRIYGSFFISTAEALLGIYICLNLASAVSRFELAGRLVSYIGSCSLFVLIFHRPFQRTAFAMASAHIGNVYVCGLLSFMAGVVLPLLVYEITKRVRIFGLLLLPSATATAPQRSALDAAT